MWVKVAGTAICLVVLLSGGALAGGNFCSIPDHTAPGLCGITYQCANLRNPWCCSRAWMPLDGSEIAKLDAFFRGWEARFRNWGVRGPVCEAIKGLEKAQRNTENLIVRLLDRGVVDVLAEPSVSAALIREGRYYTGVNQCNDRWLRAQSIYRGAAVLAIDDLGTMDLASDLLTMLGYEVYVPVGGDTVLTEMQKAEAAGNRVQAVIVDTKLLDEKMRKDVMASALSYNPDALVITATPPAGDRLVSKFRRNGFMNLLPQPYEPRRIWRILRRIVGAQNPKAKAKAQLPPHTG